MPTSKAIAAALALTSLAFAANVTWAQTNASSAPFAPLTLGPAPSQTRLANGTPGPKYWQNRVDYQIKATLDTTAGSVEGAMELRYTNNSPTTLDCIWFKIEQNVYRGTGAGADSAHAYGDVIDKFAEVIDGTVKPAQLAYRNQTEAKVMLAAPLKPGHTATFQIAWHFIVPPHSFRMGRQGSLYQIAQWYPRPNVYDDVKGWAMGTQDFYAEYGDFALALTVPSNYIVASVGKLDNPAEVLTPAQLARFTQAATSDTTVHVVTAAELTNGTAHLKQTGMVTWKFHANNARDMIWAASPRYLWDATNWKGILTQAYYRPRVATMWDEVAEMARMSVQEFSERWFPYPYPQMSIAEGPLGGGMEYPMMSFVGTFPDKHGTYMIVTHEIGHSWFPMIAGDNGWEHPWMHEGITTFISTFSEGRRYPDDGDQTARANRDVRRIETQIIQNKDFVMEDLWGNVSDLDQQYSAYDKPAGVLQMLRRDVMGPELFDKGLRTYIRTWAYKHPTSMDFFRIMNSAAGRNLDWFWREWFLETPKFDQAINSVSVTPQGNKTHVTVVYGNKEGGVMPLLVRFTFGDGTTQDFKYPVEIWKKGATYTASYTFSGKTVKEISIDPEQHFVDIDRPNNLWEAK